MTAAAVVVAGCSFWGKPLTPEQRAQADAPSPVVYFRGQAPATAASEPLGAASGYSCGSGILWTSTPPDAAKALAALRANAKKKGAAVVVGAHCERTSFFAQYQMTADPTRHAACWPGFVCNGEAMR
jgi:hypothetical protein